MGFDSGVKGYVRGVYQVVVNFPIGFNDKVEIACKFCPYLSSNERLCQLNKKPVAFPHHYVGQECPLRLEDETKCSDY